MSMRYAEGSGKDSGIVFVEAYGAKIKVFVPPSVGPGAKQSFKDECDINRIMAKAGRNGIVTWLNKHEGQYGDVSDFDFRESMDIIAKSNEMFADLPSNIRKRFANDPAEFLAFVHDDANREEAIKLGLVTPPVPKAEPVVAVPVAPVVASSVKDPGQA